MCEPRHFTVDYSINPWMKIGSVNKKEAYREWLELLEVFGKLGIEVEVIEQVEGLPDMVFAADQGIVKGDEIIISNFRYEQRQKEVHYYKKWFEKKQLKIRTLPEGVCFEGGGDSVWFGGKLLVGIGFRGGAKGIKEIRGIWGDTEVISLRLINPYFYHLDTCLFVLNQKTVFYYPDAFSPTAKRKLAQLVPNLIPIEKKEAFNFSANSVVTDHHVVLQEGNRRMMAELEGLGYKAMETSVDEFIKAGGGVHCLTGVVNETSK